MKKHVVILLGGIFIAFILMLPGCKTSEDAAAYTLTVNVGEGVNGTPVTGSYTYNENDLVTYNYSLQSGYGDLSVTLDGIPVANSGVITITGNRVLNVTATELFDIRGSWTGTMYNQYGDDFYFEATFSGTQASGSVSAYAETANNGSGSYTVTGTQIEITIEFFGITVWYEGTAADDNHLSGTWTSSTVPYGDWELERD